MAGRTRESNGRRKLSVQLLQTLGEKLTILTEELSIKVDFATSIVLALNIHHIPVD